MEKLDGKTLDLTKENINTLKRLFPEVVTEGKVDFEKLKLVLGEEVDDRKEKYEFTWHGKAQSLKLAQTPSTGTLRPDKESSKNWDSTENLYIEGDNLEVLKLLQKSYFGKVKMIYIDPPYNTGHDFVYQDDFRDNIKNYKEITEQTAKSNSETSGRYHTDWLNMIYPRIKLARNLLTEDGVFFISIDDNEKDNLSKICGEIFGEENFLATFSWRRTDNQSNIGNVAKVKEYILLYAKDKKAVKLNKMDLSDKAKKEYRYKDDNGYFRRAILLHKTRGRHEYKVTTPTGKELHGPWMITKPKMLEMIDNDEIYWTQGGEEQPYGKIYLKDSEGQIISDWLTIDFGTNQRAAKEIEDLFNIRSFDFPKPTSLIKTFIKVATNSNDIILDFFSGSATTADATMQLNAERDGKRKFIMVQLPELVNEKSKAYEAGYKNICEIGKERIRRAGAKIVEKSGKSDLDIGFKVFKLDSSNLKTWDPDTENLEQDLFDLQDNIKDGRSKEDLLYEILLKVGIPLTTPIEEVKLNDKVIYNVGFGGVLLCLEDEIDLDTVQEMIKLKPEDFDTKVIFKETGFLNDSVKTNAIQTLKKNGITDVRSV